MLRRKPLTAAALLILVMHIFRGHALTCPRAEYQIGNECCPMCPPGTRVKTDCRARSPLCLSCTERTFMNEPTGRRECFDCTSCGAGSGLKTKTSCTPTSDAVCEPLEGFFCVDSTEGGCVEAQKHSSCQPGQYISQNGTAGTDTECSGCSGGTFSDGTFPSCQPHTQCESLNLQLMKPGTASADAECGEQSSGTTGTVITAAAVGGFILILLLIGVFVCWRLRKRKGRLNRGTNADSPSLETVSEEDKGFQTDVDSSRMRRFT